jgi:hypothetical protein
MMAAGILSAAGAAVAARSSARGACEACAAAPSPSSVADASSTVPPFWVNPQEIRTCVRLFFMTANDRAPSPRKWEEIMKTFLVIACLALVALPATAALTGSNVTQSPPLDPVLCKDLADKNGDHRLDVAVFDHLIGQLAWPAPAKLEVPDEGIFVVVFKNTNSTLFDYSITSLDADSSKVIDLKADGRSVEAPPDHIVCVSWQHHEEFPVYRINITRRETAEITKKQAGQKLDEAVNNAAPALAQQSLEAMKTKVDEWKVATQNGGDPVTPLTHIQQMAAEIKDPSKREPILAAAQGAKAATEATPLLFPYTFPVWVETSDARLSFSTGLGFSTLTNERFFLKTDDNHTTATDDDKQKVERDRNGRDAFRPDLMAFATLTAPRKKSWGWIGGRLGLTFGLGIGDDSSPRYFFGPSLMLSHRMVLSLGAIGAQVKRLPAGQHIDDAPINGANTLNQLDSGFKVGVGMSISLKVGKDRDKFLAVLNPSQKVTETPKPNS